MDDQNEAALVGFLVIAISSSLVGFICGFVACWLLYVRLGGRIPL